MKRVREYDVQGDFLRCKVTFLPETEEEEFDDSTWNVYQFPLEFSWLARYPKDIYENQIRICAKSHPNLSQNLVLEEMQNFIKTLKTMYEL